MTTSALSRDAIAAQPANRNQHAMSNAAANKELLIQFLAEVWNAGDAMDRHSQRRYSRLSSHGKPDQNVRRHCVLL